jgi:hypothetical protein
MFSPRSVTFERPARSGSEPADTKAQNHYVPNFPRSAVHTTAGAASLPTKWTHDICLGKTHHFSQPGSPGTCQ